MRERNRSFELMAGLCGVMELLLLEILMLGVVMCYNVDTENPRILRADDRGGPSGDDGVDYFGFTLQFHRSGDDIWLLVGAPRDNSTQESSIYEPGQVYKCQVGDLMSGGQQLCSPLLLDNTGNAVNESIRGHKYRNGKDRQWLGVAISSDLQADDSIAIVCGHRWKNIFYETTGRNQYFMNGMCYTVSGSLDPHSVRHHVPLVEKAKQTRIVNGSGQYFYGMAQLGAAAVVFNGDDYVVGVPGLINRQGNTPIGNTVDGTTQESWVKGGVYLKRRDRSCLVLSPEDVASDSYLGYSVAVGMFMTQTKERLFIAGIPRWQHGRGQVFLFRVSENCSMDEVHRLDGEHMGSSYGTSLLVVDIEGDGFDELIVGAPFYSQSRGDEGLAVFYSIKRLAPARIISSRMVGSGGRWARFGTAISSAGKLQGANTDILVGAPYEDGGQGAVYVYSGAELLRGNRVTSYSQRIPAAQVLVGLRGFGVAVAGGVDLDGNGYPDIAVGAYNSDAVVMLGVKPLIQLDVDLTLESLIIPTLDQECAYYTWATSCIGFAVQFLYANDDPTHNTLPERIGVEFTLEGDVAAVANLRPTRGHFADPRDDTIHKTVTDTVQISKGSRYRRQYVLAFTSQMIDVLSPYLMRLNFSLVLPPPQPNDSIQPVFSRQTQSSRTVQMDFEKDCGNDSICNADLEVTLTPRITDQNHVDFHILGSGRALIVDVTIQNHGESAHTTEIYFRFTTGLQFSQVELQDGGNRISCLPLEEENAEEGFAGLQCEVAYILKTTEEFSVYFDTSQLRRSLSHAVEVIATPRTLSNNSHRVDPRVDLPLRMESHLRAIGASSPREHVLAVTHSPSAASTVGVKHALDIINTGPGEADDIVIIMSVPIHHDDAKLASVIGVQVLGGSWNKIAETELNNLPTLGTIPIVNIPESRLIEITSSFDDFFSSSAHPFIVNCEQSQCIQLAYGGHLGRDESISIYVDLEIDPTLILNSREFNGIYYEADYSIYPYNLSLGGVDSKERNLTTQGTIRVRTVLYRDAGDSDSGDIPWWVILVCAGVGLFLLLIVLLVMKKLGFFRRKKFEDLKRLVDERDGDKTTENLNEADPGEIDSEVSGPYMDMTNSSPQLEEDDGYLNPLQN